MGNTPASLLQKQGRDDRTETRQIALESKTKTDGPQEENHPFV
jgi:hypothetical protein